MGIVGIARADHLRLGTGIGEAIERAGGIRTKSDQICVKINLCECRTPETGAVTDPRFLEAFLLYVKNHLSPEAIFVVESNATTARPNLIMKWLGYEKVLRRFNATWVNLSATPTATVRIQGRHSRELDVPQLVLDSCLVSLAKLKTHILTKISCGLKNVYGCLPYPRKIVFHSFLDDMIVDANLAMRPAFSVIDGVISHVGTQGPAYGIPVKVNAILAGADSVLSLIHI